MRAIAIENVGAIERLEIPIPEGGGVVVLQGRNGLGKSTAIDAVAALIDGEGALSPRDGEERGSVRGLGCEVTVKKRTSHAGTLEVQRIQGEDPALLVDPGVADPIAADRARIRALCRLAKVKPSKALFAGLEELAGVPLPITLAEDLPESAAKTKRAIQVKARDVEDQANTAAGRMQSLLGRIGQVPLDGPCDAAELAEASDEATRALLRAEGEAEGRGRALQAAQGAREALEGARAAYSGPTVADAQATLAAAESAEESAREALARAQNVKAAARADALRAREFATACEGWQAAITAAEGLSEADEAGLEALRGKARAAREADALGRDIRRAREQRAEAEKAMHEMDALRQQAERLREAADGCDQVVSDAIASVAPRGLAVEGDRLTVEHARGRIPFAELSHGERWTIALDVGIDAVGENGLLSIAQEAWEGLDIAHRQQIAEHARRRKAVVLTAEATMSDLSTEIL